MPAALFPHHSRTTMHQQLRDLFRELGGSVPMRVLGEEAMARGVIPPEEVARCTLRGIQEICRRALKFKTENGVPFAKPMGEDETDTETRWKQLELFTLIEARAMILRHVKSLREDHSELLVLHRWCFAKFGEAPDIPELQGGE